MSLTSNMFFLFTVLGLCIYYVVPKRLQWIVLLVLSYAYYLITSCTGNRIFDLFDRCYIWSSNLD